MEHRTAMKNAAPTMHASLYMRRKGISCSRSVVGFTLVELMIVIVILAIAAAVVVPMASSAGGTQIRAATNMLAADLEYAKSMAISRGTQDGYAVRFDKVNETYQIEDNSKPIGDPDRVIDHPVHKGSKYIVAFGSDGRLDRVEIADASFDGTSVVIFNYLGSPFNGGGLGSPLNNGVVTLQASGVTRSVNVEPVAGFVSISD